MKRMFRFLLAIVITMPFYAYSREWYFGVGQVIATDTTITDTVPLCPSLVYHCRVSIAPKERGARWTIVMSDIDDGEISTIDFERKGAAIDEADFGAAIDVTVNTADMHKHYTIDGNLRSAEDELSLVIRPNEECDSLYCVIGRTEAIIDFTMQLDMLKHISFTRNRGVKLKRLSCMQGYDKLQDAGIDINYNQRFDVTKLDSIVNSADNTLQGVWSYLDRDSDPRLLNMGGDYELVIQGKENVFEIYYLNGARVGAKKWREGALKGILQPTRFINHYNLVWLDALGRPISREASADFIDGSILRLNFPLYRSTVRFYKKSKPVR